jgi:hypothetical protein
VNSHDAAPDIDAILKPPSDLAVRYAEAVRNMLDTKRRIEAETGDYTATRDVLPAQRMFHRSRVAQRFKVIEEAVYLSKLRQAQGPPVT